MSKHNQNAAENRDKLARKPAKPPAQDSIARNHQALDNALRAPQQPGSAQLLPRGR
jgi:hypothetical protein